MTNPNVQTFLNEVFKIIGVYSTGEDMSAEDMDTGLRALNSMLASWYKQRYLKPNLDRLEFTTVSGVATYLFGVDDLSGNTLASAVRPIQVLSAYLVKTGDYDKPISVIAPEEYDRLYDKSSAGDPHKLAYDPGLSTGYMWIYRVPDGAFTVKMRCLVEHGAYSSALDTFLLPNMYWEAVMFNLALRLCSRFGTRLQAQDARTAQFELDELKSVNQNPAPVAKQESSIYRSRSGGLSVRGTR